MPYSSEIRVSSQTSGRFSGPVSIQLWEISTTFDQSNRFRDVQTDQERVTVTVAGAANTTFSTMDGPSYSARNNHDIAISAYQGTQPGPIFRSGRLQSLPPGSPGDPSSLLDTMLLDPRRFTIAEINMMITTPITLPDGTVVSTATVVSAPPSRTLTLTATGPYGRTTYTYTLPFTIDPSDDQIDLTSVLEANTAGTATITFVASPGGGFQALLDNLFSGLLIGQINSRVLNTITNTLNTSAAAAAANAVAAFGFTGGLPAGVILGVRSVGVAANGDVVMAPAVGTFGSLASKFLQAAPSASPSSTCFLATAAVGADAPELALMREFRANHLLQSRSGRLFVRTYEYVSPPLARVVSRSPLLRRATRRLLIEPIAVLIQRYTRARSCL
jgi:hypothetical protein